MSETKKSDLPDYSSLDATFVIKNTEGRDSSFIINGTFREDLITEIKSTIHNYIQKSGQTLVSSSWSAQSVTTPLEDSSNGEKQNAKD